MPDKTEKPLSEERPKRVTLQDIADVAGVNKMAVSNALNGTRRVSPAMRAKIKQIAQDLNYVPHFAARALRTGRTGIIAIVSGSLTEPYYAHMVELLEKHIQGNGFHLMLMRTREEVRALFNATSNIVVDGVIAVDMWDIVNEFQSQSTIPCVSVGTIQPSFVDNVIVDLSEGVGEALRLMVADGRKRIAYLVTTLSMESGTEVRARTYLETMRQVNQTPEIIDVMSDDIEVIEIRLREHIVEHGCPDAIQCQNDETAMCAARALKSLGLKVPKDVLLVGCDGQPHMRDFEPPLSTIVQPMEDMCAKAWQFLHQRIAEPTLPHQKATFVGKLVVTESLKASTSTP